MPFTLFKWSTTTKCLNPSTLNTVYTRSNEKNSGTHRALEFIYYLKSIQSPSSPSCTSNPSMSSATLLLLSTAPPLFPPLPVGRSSSAATVPGPGSRVYAYSEGFTSYKNAAVGPQPPMDLAWLDTTLTPPPPTPPCALPPWLCCFPVYRSFFTGMLRCLPPRLVIGISKGSPTSASSVVFRASPLSLCEPLDQLLRGYLAVYNPSMSKLASSWSPSNQLDLRNLWPSKLSREEVRLSCS